MTVGQIGQNMATKKNSKPERLTDKWDRKPMAIQMRGSDAWRAWVERGAKHVGLKTPSVIDQALRMYFREMGFSEAPPER